MTSPLFPQICKTNRVIGKNLVFRNATISDAAFILSLRTDSIKGQYLSKTSFELDQQIAWLEDYERKTDQAYFIIENKDAENLGTVRLYDQQKDSFCWGSWILKNGAPKTSAIESVMMVYVYACDHLGFKNAHFEVRKENKSVWRFHERFGAERVSESRENYYYILEQKKIVETLQRYSNYLPQPLIIE